ncbi:MAG TPA: helix-turn-helix domain-containing protein, partial [Ohtaekwangia sp.]
EVKSRMTDPGYAHLTLLAIALESGFNSKTSFNTVFKKLTGQTPSQYVATTKSIPASQKS